SIQNRGNQPRRTMHCPKQRADFFPRQNNRKLLLPSRSDDVVDPRQRIIQNMPVKENQRAERLRLRRCTDFSLDRQMREKRVDLLGSHRGRMTLSMKEDETPRPADVRLFRAAAVVTRPRRSANATEKAR